MIAILVAGIVNTALITDKMTAAQLDHTCLERRRSSVEVCRAFIISGANTMLDPTGSFRKICAPNIGYRQFRDTFSGYVKVHADEAVRPAVIVILEAFEQAYPCH